MRGTYGSFIGENGMSKVICNIFKFIQRYREREKKEKNGKEKKGGAICDYV